ncbi:MAG TPA: universal stress protein [Candidatus Acidoferrum sp.]|nr:universal stress protein [Candidatus Acidoferrum sp.]
MRVLIALDVTTQRTEIVNEAAFRPWPAESTFLLMHVLDPFPFVKAPISLKRAQAAAALQLKNASKSLVEAGWKTETDVILGMPRRLVSQIAASWHADLVMVGSNEIGALTRLFLGSTARSVLRHAPCSVEIVRPGSTEKQASQPRGMKILVATDGSVYSTAAIQSVASRPWPQGSNGRVISIPEPFMPLGQFPYFELKEIDALNTAALQDAKRYAEFGAEVLSKAGLEATAETPLPIDSDAREIVKEAERWQAQIVVLGSHGRRGFDLMTMGSVSEHVALHAPCSVEVIRAALGPNKKSKKLSKRGAIK